MTTPGASGSEHVPLTLAEESLQLALEAANAIAWDWTLATDACVCFGNLPEVLGVSGDVMRGTMEEFRHWIHPDDRERVMQKLQHAARQRAFFEAECRVVREDGSIRWIKAKGRCHYSPAGATERMLGITIDVTDHHRAEEERRRWEHRFSEFFDALPQTCYFVTPDARIADLNPSACRAWGYTKEELAGKPLATIIAPELHPRMWALVDQWKRTGVLSNEELVIVTKSGARRTVLVSAGAVCDTDGRPLHSASVQVDITEYKQAERELLQLNEAVAHMDRVASMAEMAAALAHEVRQPLTALISNADAAARFLDAREPDLAEVRSALTEIVADGNRVDQVVRNLRSIFRRELAPRRRIDVNTVVQELGRLAQKQLAARGVELTLDLSSEPVPVLAEPSLLQQVIVNLMNNGLDAMGSRPPGARSLVIHTTTTPAGDLGVIRVEDTGPGVPEDEVPKLFTRFHTTKRDGLGMGLCVCRNILRSLGGAIEYEAGAQGGAVFRVELPLSLDRPSV